MTPTPENLPVRFLRQRAVQQLLDNAVKEPQKYDAEATPNWDGLDEIGTWYITQTDPTFPTAMELQDTLSKSACKSTSDATDSLAIYSALSSLTLQQAADERLWVGLSHFELYEYVRKRWSARLGIECDTDLKSSYVRAHWFVSGARGIYRDNGVSRLWWMGRILTQIAKETGLTPKKVGELLLHTADVHANLIERSTTASNLPVACEIVQTLHHYTKLVDKPRIYERNVFRQWMVRLNQLGGTLVLDALPRDTLRTLIRNEAQQALGN